MHVDDSLEQMAFGRSRAVFDHFLSLPTMSRRNARLPASKAGRTWLPRPIMQVPVDRARLRRVRTTLLPCPGTSVSATDHGALLRLSVVDHHIGTAHETGAYHTLYLGE